MRNKKVPRFYILDVFEIQFPSSVFETFSKFPVRLTQSSSAAVKIYEIEKVGQLFRFLRRTRSIVFLKYVGTYFPRKFHLLDPVRFRDTKISPTVKLGFFKKKNATKKNTPPPFTTSRC